MARYGKNDEPNDTISWIPAVFRDLLGLNEDFQRPQYSSYGNSRREMADSTTSWIPAFARRYLGLEYTEPQRYPPSQSFAEPAARSAPPPPVVRSYAAPTRTSYTAPARTEYTPPTRTEYTPPARPEYPPPPARSADSGTPGASSTGGSASYDAPYPQGVERMKFRSSGAGTSGGEGRAPVARADGQPVRFEGAVQPLTYLPRAYLRGALPPQGLEEFLRLLGKTTQDVFGMYQQLIGFNTEELTSVIDRWRRSGPPTTTTMKRVPVEVSRATANVGATPPAPPAPVDLANANER